MVQQLWFILALGIHILQHVRLAQWLQQWIINPDKVASHLSSVTLSLIWKGRNQLIFNKTTFCPVSTAKEISNFSAEFFIANPLKMKSVRVSELESWEQPNVGTTKINVDAGCFQTGTTGWGCLARDHTGTRVPKKYVEKYWKGISNPIFIKFPNGVQQEIFWVERNGDIWFQKNWESFAKFLKYGYLLTFKFIGGSYFKVKIFGANTLEINYSNIKSVDEGAEDTKEEGKESDESSDDEATEESHEDSDESSDESSDEVEMPKQVQRNGKRKVSMDFDTTQPKFSGSKKVAMVKKARKYQTSEAVNENTSFEVTMTQSYANGYFLWIPFEFSREHLKDFNGTATIRVGNDRSVEVSLRYYGTQKKYGMGGGWKLFRQKYNLQVDDVCKFEMIQGRPSSFIVTITRAINKPSPKKSLGHKKGVSCGKSVVKKEHIGGTSRSHPKVKEEGRDVKEHKTFKVFLKNKTPCVPKEFMKKGCNENIVELKMGRKSWFVKVNFYRSLCGCRFSKGWRQFMKAGKVEIGDTCLFKLIDERKFVFDVSIVGKNT
ncbi:B3 domain-containing protein_Os12g40080-like [Medicago truncatula]|uniref:B3 domain-containing protein_Os12g40080-like n=1 Tax=Medicago truncatula TaxID=3880 RepID=UPI001966E8C9|nr:B3 domain-containing protein LOC_Os12g40080-like [Medicago truncatula]